MNRIASFFTPLRIVWAYLICFAALLGAGYLSPVSAPVPGTPAWAREAIFVFRAVTGYFVAFALCVAVAREHRGDSWLRLAWIAFAVNAAASIARHSVDTRLWDLASPGFLEGPRAAELRQIFIVIALGALLAGVCMMVWAFHRLGLGLSPRRIDMLAIAGIIATLVVILLHRESLNETRSASALAIVLQQVGLVLLALGGALSVLVYRLAREMSGGRLAATMLCIAIYAAFRCFMVCLTLAPQLRVALAPFTMPVEFAVPWIFALAASYRYGLAQHGAARIPRSSPILPRLKQTFPATPRIF